MTVTSLVFNSYDNCMCPYLRFARIYLLDFDPTSQKYIVNNNMIYLSSFADALRLGIPLLVTSFLFLCRGYRPKPLCSGSPPSCE